MLPNMLQYPIALFGALRAGLTVVNTNPLYTATELEHQLSDSGATAIVVLENFAHVREQVAAAHPGAARARDRGRRYLQFPKSRSSISSCATCASRCRAGAFPGAIGFGRGARPAATCRCAPVEVDARGSRLPAVHRRHDGRRQGRDAHPRQRRTNVLQAAPGSARPSSGRRSVTAIPLYHIFALYGELHGVRAPGLDQRADRQSPRPRRFIGEMKQHPPNSSAA